MIYKYFETVEAEITKTRRRFEDKNVIMYCDLAQDLSNIPNVHNFILFPAVVLNVLICGWKISFGGFRPSTATIAKAETSEWVPRVRAAFMAGTGKIKQKND